MVLKLRRDDLFDKNLTGANILFYRLQHHRFSINWVFFAANDRISVTETNELLISWYLKNRRDLPWRDTTDPYFIWLSEVILQQTRVNQGMDYYLRFTEQYPTVTHLAKATQEEVLKLWQGLGYYSRARNLHATAKLIVEEHGGQFPRTHQGLLALKGIGPYTAAAIASFAYRLAYAVVDGNVQRVLSRLFDIDLPVNGASGKRTIEALAQEFLHTSQPDVHNQAIMELGALICTPQGPACAKCPLSSHCMALACGTVAERPVKTAKKKATERHMHYAVVMHRGRLLFRKRGAQDIWQGLHDFPSLEGELNPTPQAMRDLVATHFPKGSITKAPLSPHRLYTHLLTHRRIQAGFWWFEADADFPENSVYLSVPIERIHDVAVPKLVHRYLADCDLL
jgi:A/G-specific adenine glycosylase